MKEEKAEKRKVSLVNWLPSLVVLVLAGVLLYPEVVKEWGKRKTKA